MSADNTFPLGRILHAFNVQQVASRAVGNQSVQERLNALVLKHPDLVKSGRLRKYPIGVSGEGRILYMLALGEPGAMHKHSDEQFSGLWIGTPHPDENNGTHTILDGFDALANEYETFTQLDTTLYAMVELDSDGAALQRNDASRYPELEPWQQRILNSVRIASNDKYWVCPVDYRGYRHTPYGPDSRPEGHAIMQAIFDAMPNSMANFHDSQTGGGNQLLVIGSDQAQIWNDCVTIAGALGLEDVPQPQEQERQRPYPQASIFEAFSIHQWIDDIHTHGWDLNSLAGLGECPEWYWARLAPRHGINDFKAILTELPRTVVTEKPGAPPLLADGAAVWFDSMDDINAFTDEVLAHPERWSSLEEFALAQNVTEGIQLVTFQLEPVSGRSRRTDAFGGSTDASFDMRIMRHTLMLRQFGNLINLAHDLGDEHWERYFVDKFKLQSEGLKQSATFTQLPERTMRVGQFAMGLTALCAQRGIEFNMQGVTQELESARELFAVGTGREIN